MLGVMRRSLRWVWIRKRLRWLALAVNVSEEMQIRANQTGRELRDQDICLLSSVLKSLGSVPISKGLSKSLPENHSEHLGTPVSRILYPSVQCTVRLDWKSALYLAAYEVFYALGERGVGELEKIANTRDRRFSLVAFEILILLATEGIDTDRIASFLPKNLDGHIAEDVDLLMESMGRFCAVSSVMFDGMVGYLESLGVCDPITELECLVQLELHCPRLVKARSTALERTMFDVSPSPRHKVMTVHTPEDPYLVVGKVTFPRFPDKHTIRAALLLITHYPKRSDILTALRYWERHHPLKEFTAEISRFFSEYDRPHEP